AQSSPYWMDMVLRADGSHGAAVATAVRQELRRLNSELLLENDASFDGIIANSLALERTQSAFAVMIGSLAVVVTGIGLYALMTFVAAQQRRELGIRIALGSSPGRLFRDAMKSGLTLVGMGIIAGVGATMLIVRTVGSQVFGLAAT